MEQTNNDERIKQIYQEQKLNFSRFLYPVHYIKYAIISCIIYKHDFNEVIFWVCEFYHSGYYYKSWELLHFIYYCFYSLTYPDFGNRIDKLYDKWKHKCKIMETFISQLTNQDTHFTACIPSHYNLTIKELHNLNLEMLNDILFCYKNLHIKEHNDIIYNLYWSFQTISLQNQENIVTKNNEIKLNNETFINICKTKRYNEFFILFTELFKNNYNLNNGFYPSEFTEFLSELLKTFNVKLHKNIKQFFECEIIVPFNNMIQKELFNYLYIIGYCFYEINSLKREKISKLLFIQLNNSQKDSIKTNTIITPFTDFINKYEIICNQTNISNICTNICNYNLLIKSNISFIPLPNEINNFNKFINFEYNITLSKDLNREILFYHWDIFVFNTPIWKSRFIHYYAIIDTQICNISFKNDDLLEKFYDLYYYEIDEQSKKIYDKFLLDIN